MDKQQQITALAAQLVQFAMASGLTWDETIGAFGLAAKALADGASREGDGPLYDCVAHAQKRFAEGIAQPVQLVFAASDLSQLRQAYDADQSAAEAILANTNVRVALKPH